MGNDGYYMATIGGKQIRLALKYLAIILLVVGFTAGFVTGFLMKTHLIYGKGRVVIMNLDVYSDEASTVVLTEIDWGTLEPGDSKNFTAYVKNNGNVPFNMSISTENWVPVEAVMYITLSWDYGGQTISSGEVLQLTFTLTVASNISGVGAFVFDIVITATEV